MAGLFKFLGWLFGLFGTLFVLCFIWALASYEADDIAALPGLGFFVVITAVPAILFFKKANNIKRKNDLINFIKVMQTFSLAEAAKKTNKSDSETEALVIKVAAENHIKLAFHKGKQKFYRPGTLREAHSVMEKCPSCNAAIGAQLVFADETFSCQFCGHAIKSSY